MKRLRDDRGAIAIVFALCTVLLFTVAALGVDLGNAFNRKRQLQTQADFAALAGGSLLPAPATTPTQNDDVVKAVAKYLISNNVYSDDGRSMPTATTLAGYLVDPSKKSQWGQVYYGYFDSTGALVSDKNYLSVVAPRATVNFGLATAAGFSKVNEQAVATVALRSPGSVGATLPFYAYSGCDWGNQTIDQPTNNPAAPGLAIPNDNSNRLSLTDASTAAPNASPSHINAGDNNTVLTLTGTNLDRATALGFFLDDGTTMVSLPKAKFTSQSSTQITFTLGDNAVQTVLNNTSVWYLRVLDDNNKWSGISVQQPYVAVGDATLYCRGGKNQGNFGSLEIARDDSSKSASDGWLVRNIANGIESPKASLAVYTAAITSNSCDGGDPNAVFTDSTPTPNANCVTTDTGFAQNPATNGLITGTNTGVTGRLAKNPNGCGNATPRFVLNTNINNEVLTCYFTDPNVTVAQVSSQNYSGGRVISSTIFSSPRFFWIPVVSQQPGNGHKSFPIIDFRPAFMTGEKGTATLNVPTFADDATTNGLVIAQNHVDSFRLVFINPDALPPVGGAGNPIPYAGSGDKVTVLVN